MDSFLSIFPPEICEDLDGCYRNCLTPLSRAECETIFYDEMIDYCND